MEVNYPSLLIGIVIGAVISLFISLSFLFYGGEIKEEVNPSLTVDAKVDWDKPPHRISGTLFFEINNIRKGKISGMERIIKTSSNLILEGENSEHKLPKEVFSVGEGESWPESFKITPEAGFFSSKYVHKNNKTVVYRIPDNHWIYMKVQNPNTGEVFLEDNRFFQGKSEISFSS